MTVSYQYGLPRILKGVTSGDVGSGVAECDAQIGGKTTDLS